MDSTPPEEEPAAPSFDLSDADETADPGEAVQEPVAVAPAPKSGSSTEDEVFQAISGVLIDLANDLRRSLEYYSSRYSQMPQRIFLSGGTAKMPNLGEFLNRELGVQVDVADPLKNLKVNIPGASERYLKEMSPLFAISIGLAIRDMVGE